MAKKCISCGEELADDVMFCDKCGASQKTETAASDVAEKGGMSKTTLIAIAGAAAVAVIVIIVLATTLLGGGYQKPIKNAQKAISKEKGDKFVKAYPEELVDAFDDYLDESSDKDFAESVDDSIESLVEYAEDEYGKDCKSTFKTVDTIKLNEDELDDVSKELEKATDEDIDVKKGYKVVYKVTIDGKKEKMEEFDTCTIVKAFGKWVFYSGSPIGGNAASLPELDD